MCGIAGFSGGPDPRRIAAMCDLLAHRGPDDHGYYTSPCNEMTLGHRRLSIIDLGTGHQPMSNEDGSIWVVFNGEIYNYKELIEELRPRHRFATHSDTEVLVHLYEELGPDMVHRLNGMFSFALWDERRHRLLLVRDRLGVKPLYWAQVGGRLGFASEMKALLSWPELDRAVDPAAVSHYLSLRYVPEPATIWKGIQALPPGHLMEWSPGDRPQPRRYWTLDFTPADWPDEDALCDRVEELLLDATRLRMRSDVPVGAYLSGGVDSSLIVAMVRRHFGGQLHTFTLGYADQPADKQDLFYARRLAAKYGTDHHEYIMDARELADAALDVARFFDQPFAGVVSTYFLTGLVRKHVKVVLSGDGADDQFASYGHHRLVWPLERLAAERALNPEAPLEAVDLSPLADRPDYVRRFAGMTPWQMRANFGAFPPPLKAELLATPAGRVVAEHDTVAWLHQAFRSSRATDGLNRMLDVDIATSLPGEILAFCDRLSMAHSVEVRAPFLDYRLTELAATIPGTLKIKAGTLKYILKKTAQRYLPAEILDRPKEGFIQPNHVWLRGPLDPLIDRMLSPAGLDRHGLFDPSVVGRLVAEHRSGTADHAFRIWALVMFQAWYETYLGQSPWPATL
ncbi:Asparagine synthetase [Magnetospirillum sp. LM-5]|uniref:asparagine synthase (glutamine-hydrolyzing) n=1 Tax=Magnetospirillum sp. LM-5 TaxID=2681466 RepID=UPI0013829FED|nr:asparagine synthase (glutamine-hydrolyzing) [Magnetospirillum sp. LM-5]CAA7618719.1 Asparagine synthetase [Magnetospirillum sp. LM-5]